MQFSSLLFIYYFLPICLLCYFLTPHKFKNYVLLLASLIFFAWGGVSFTIILFVSIIANYFFGIAIEAHQNRSKLYLYLGIGFNLLLLGVFKYTDFVIENINQLLSITNHSSFGKSGIVLPVGISFYTFHSISYLVDIAKGKCTAQKNIFNLALYIAMFSQLIAGPIIRYSDVWQQLIARSHQLSGFVYGIKRFIIGLSKKVLLANTLALTADQIFNLELQQMNAPISWLGLMCYTLQIYFDFSGYSDMAIGLGHMFGFNFKENFNLPYSATSVQDFWRRWHISLSSFFRDYVYIPLGGNKLGQMRTYINLFTVFFLTGFWHGASYNFIVWGLFHGFFLILERLGFAKFLAKLWSPISNVYTFLIVMLGWVLFRSNNLEAAIHFYKSMFDFHLHPDQMFAFYSFLNPELMVVLSIAIFFSFKFSESVAALYLRFSFHIQGSVHFIQNSIYLILLFICTLYLISGSYNPFIYYRF